MKILNKINKIFTQANVFFSSQVYKFRSSERYKKIKEVVRIVIIIGLGAVILPLIAPAHAGEELRKHKDRYGRPQGAHVPASEPQTTGVRSSDTEIQESPADLWDRIVKPNYARSFKGLKDIHFEKTDRPLQNTNTPNWEDFCTPICLYNDNGKSFEKSISFLVKHEKVLDFYNLGTEHMKKLKESILRTVIDITPNDQKSNVSLRIKFGTQDPFRPRILLSSLIYKEKQTLTGKLKKRQEKIHDQTLKKLHSEIGEFIDQTEKVDFEKASADIITLQNSSDLIRKRFGSKVCSIEINKPSLTAFEELYLKWKILLPMMDAPPEGVTWKFTKIKKGENKLELSSYQRLNYRVISTELIQKLKERNASPNSSSESTNEFLQNNSADPEFRAFLSSFLK